MNADSYRELRVLTDVSSDGFVTQRGLAKKYGLALGLTNLLIRRLIRRGHIKIVNLQRNRLQYLVTPQGLTEKARLTYAYIEYSLYFYRQVREFLTRALATIPSSAGKKIVLCGTGEVAEIAFLLLRPNGCDVVAVVDPQPAGAMFLGQPVRGLEELPVMSFDWALITVLNHREQMKQQLRQHGVPEAKIITIPEEGTPAFQASVPLLETPSPDGALGVSKP